MKVNCHGVGWDVTGGKSTQSLQPPVRYRSEDGVMVYMMGWRPAMVEDMTSAAERREGRGEERRGE